MTRTSIPPDDVRADGAREFEEFYAASFAPLCAQLFAHTGQLAEAQDVVQEAFIRAYTRWSNLRTYDDPVAWVRKVAWNLAISRWRRLRRHVPWHADAEGQVPPLSADHLALRAALAELPRRQRQAVVLHYLADLPISEVARITGAAEGTVKSWLHRARTSLAATLTDSDPAAEAGGLPAAVAGHVTPPGADHVARTVRRRRAARTTAAGALVLAILLTGAVLLPGRGGPDPAVTTPPMSASPSSTPSPTASTASPTASATTPTGDSGQAAGPGSGATQSGSGGTCPPMDAVEVVTTGDQPGWYAATFDPPEFSEQACRDASVQVMWATYVPDGAGNMIYAAGDARRLSAASPTWTFETYRLLTGCFHFYVVVGDVAARSFIPADQVGSDQWHDPLYAYNGTSGRIFWGWSSDCLAPPSTTITGPPG